MYGPGGTGGGAVEESLGAVHYGAGSAARHSTLYPLPDQDLWRNKIGGYH
jgi:hypothetical protein